MRIMARGIIWFGLYIFLVTLPLTTAMIVSPERATGPLILEIAVGAGFVGLALMAMEFALISRISPAAHPFGEDSLQLFHNIMGMVALGLILLHPILLIIYGYPASCWLNPFAGCANTATATAALALYALLILVVSSIWRKRLRIRYEIWYVMHGLLALFVVLAAMVHIFVIGRYTSTPLMQLMWVFYAGLVITLIGWYKIVVPIRNWNKKWEIVENRVERGDARTLFLKPLGHDGFSFLPGQFAWLKTGRTPFGMGHHPVSLSSMGDVQADGQVSFTIKNLGDWSGEEVPAMQPGDTMWLDGPHGVFSIDREEAMGYVFIAGGVGITPLYSMCQTMAEREDVRPVILFYGGADWESLTLRDELEALTEHMNLTVVFVLSDPEEDWQGESGYITAEIMKPYLPKQFKRFKYLICGPKPLMDSMEEALPALGVPDERVISERFDMA